MGQMIIKDGEGSGRNAKVDSVGRIHTHSVSETIGQDASKDGRSYNVNTGTITLTSATASGLLFIENTGDTPIHISTVGFLIGNSTGGTGDLTLNITKNITGGTLESAATAPEIIANKNAGSNLSLDAYVYAGVEGSTVTGGTAFYTSLLAGAARPYIISTGDIVLPRGSNIAVSVTPQTSNTSMNIQVFLAINEYNLT